MSGPFENKPWSPPTQPVSAGPMPPASPWPSTNVPIAAAEVKVELPEWLLLRLKAAKLTEDKDGALVLWQRSKTTLEDAKNDEMELRKVCVAFLVPDKTEGTTNVELGGGFKAKAVVKFNYNLKAPEGSKKDIVDEVDDIIDAAPTISNEAPFILDRIFNWKVELGLAEYKKLMEEAEGDANKAKLLKLVQRVVEKKEAAPTLSITEPKVKK